MRRAGLGGLTVAWVVGLGVAVATTRGAESEGKPPVAKGLLSGFFGEKPKGQAKTTSKVLVDKPPEPTSTIESAHAQQQRFQNALLRRMDVCLRLQTIANETGNETLRNQAFELEQRANEIYRQQTAGLPLPAPSPASLAPDNALMANGSQSNRASQVLARDTEETMVVPQPPLMGGAPARLGDRADQSAQAILNGTKRGE
jgi:hypothetical protein